MATRDENRNQRAHDREQAPNRTERQSSVLNDLPDSARDEERLQPEETILNLPDVKDIPGQEFVHVLPLGELADTTIASADEEGEGLFEEDTDDETEDLLRGTEGRVQRNERAALDDVNYQPTRDEDNLRRAAMDNTDADGEALNEGSFGPEQNVRDL